MSESQQDLFIYHDNSWDNEDLQWLASGKILIWNGKRYAMCQDCHNIVRIDKPFIGSMHDCYSQSRPRRIV